MKVYIVTDGDYSDYTIQKVFSNKEAAEEYKYWHHIANEIEEYEVADTAMDTEDQRYMFIRVYGTSYPEAVVDIKYEINPQTISDNHIKRGAGLWDYRNYNKTGAFTLYNYHYIPAENWDEEKYKEKYTKALYDQAALIRSMFADGAEVDMINKVLRTTEEEE